MEKFPIEELMAIKGNGTDFQQINVYRPQQIKLHRPNTQS